MELYDFLEPMFVDEKRGVLTGDGRGVRGLRI